MDAMGLSNRLRRPTMGTRWLDRGVPRSGPSTRIQTPALADDYRALQDRVSPTVTGMTSLTSIV
jgi:hypothetical protein